MRLLVLGGTSWLGGCIATSALEHGHHVTCLARGDSGAAPDGATFVRADRDKPDAYDGVIHDAWDAVVYADHGTPGADEVAVLLPALAGDVMETYGEAKVACEERVLDRSGRTDPSSCVRV